MKNLNVDFDDSSKLFFFVLFFDCSYQLCMNICYLTVHKKILDFLRMEIKIYKKYFFPPIHGFHTKSLEDAMDAIRKSKGPAKISQGKSYENN
jgi:hypothetical protein